MYKNYVEINIISILSCCPLVLRQEIESYIQISISFFDLVKHFVLTSSKKENYHLKGF